MITPSALLGAAADRVRDLAANDLTPGRWEVRVTPSEDPLEDDTVWIANPSGSTVAVVGEHYTSAPRDAAWIAALSPAVAPHLEAILRARAEVIRWAKSWDEVADIGEYHLARSILGVGSQ